MSEQDLQRWQAAAMALTEAEIKPIGMPISTFLVEADGVAKMAEELWEPAKDGSRPGLSAVKKRLGGATIVDDIKSLTAANRTAHASVLYPREAPGDRSKDLARAEVLLAEIRAATEFVLDDGVEEPEDVAFAEAKARASEDSTFATFVQTLFDIATIASELRPRFVDLKDFDAKNIDEALALASTLSQGGPAKVGAPASKDVDLRNRLLALLNAKVGLVRRAVAYVFRNQPEIVRRVTSSYKRAQRMELRRRKKEKGEPEVA